MSSNINTKKSPWIIYNLKEELNQKLLKHFRGERNGFIQVGAKKYFFPQKFAIEGENYYFFKPRPTDTWVISFPRSGTTWTQEMIWLLGNNLNYVKSAETPLIQRFPFLEFNACVNDEVLDEFKSNAPNEDIKKELETACSSILNELNNMKEPRFIKSHLPFSLLSPDLLTCGAKVIYVARNPKDVAASYYNFHQFIKTLDYVGDFNTFWNFFEQNLELWTPYWDHVKEAWEFKDNPNLLFLFYENMKKDLRGNIEKAAKFLGKQYSSEEILKLEDHLSFQNFKNNQSVNMEILRDLGMLFDNSQRCVREGKAGGWKQLFTTELNDQANKWIVKNLTETNINFPEI